MPTLAPHTVYKKEKYRCPTSGGTYRSYVFNIYGSPDFRVRE